MNHPICLSTYSTLPPADANKSTISKEVVKLTKQLASIQSKLYAQHQYSILIILQGIDTSGKDNSIRTVFKGINPSGCHVTSFKKPTLLETDQHFLWRIQKVCPPLGMIGVFNRSQYEDIVVPMNDVNNPAKYLQLRCNEINNFEEGLVSANTIVFKFFIHIGYAVMCKRIAERKKQIHKRWKYIESDSISEKVFDIYQKKFDYVFERCSAVPWFIIPGDKKWYKNYCILHTIVTKLKSYAIEYPIKQT